METFSSPFCLFRLIVLFFFIQLSVVTVSSTKPVESKESISKIEDLEKELNDLRIKNKEIEEQLSALKIKNSKIEETNTNPKSSTGKKETTTLKTQESDDKIKTSTGETEATTSKAEVTTSKTEVTDSKIDTSSSKIKETTSITKATILKTEGSVGKNKTSAINTESTTSKTKATDSKIKASTSKPKTTASITEATILKTEGSTDKTKTSAIKTEAYTSKKESTASNLEVSLPKNETTAIKTGTSTDNSVASSTAAKDECFKKNLGSLLNVTVAYKQRLNRRVFKIVVNDGRNFASILTGNCTVEHFPGMTLEYRMKGSEDWSEVDVELIQEDGKIATTLEEAKEAKVRVESGEELDYCQVYEIMLKINNNENKSDIIEFGPLKDEFTVDDLKALDEDVFAIDRININFEELTDKFNATWSNICAESLKIWLQNGIDSKDAVYKNITNLSESKFSRSIIIPTEPCTKYHLELETFLSKDPKTKDIQHGTNYGGKHYFISSPQQETFGRIKMEENSTILSWDLKEYFRNSNKSTPICVVSESLSYNITFGIIGGEKHMLKESTNPQVNTSEILDIEKAIEKAINQTEINDLEKFCPYEVKMEISYETKQTKHMKQANRTRIRTFSQYLLTNSGGNFSVTTKPILKLTDFNLRVGDISQTSTCLNKNYTFECWRTEGNKTLFLNLNETESADTIDVLKSNFTADYDYKCRVNIEFLDPEDNQSSILTITSEALAFTAPAQETSSAGTIVGVVILVLVLVGGVAAVLYYRKRYYRVDITNRNQNPTYGT